MGGSAGEQKQREREQEQEQAQGQQHQPREKLFACHLHHQRRKASMARAGGPREGWQSFSVFHHPPADLVGRERGGAVVTETTTTTTTTALGAAGASPEESAECCGPPPVREEGSRMGEADGAVGAGARPKVGVQEDLRGAATAATAAVAAASAAIVDVAEDAGRARAKRPRV